MFLKRKVLPVLVVGFCVVVFVKPSFVENKAEPAPATQADTSVVEENPDEKARVIPANYQAVELVREFGKGILGQGGRIDFSPDNKIVYVSDALERQIAAFNKDGDLLFRIGGRKLDYVAKADEESGAREAYERENEDKFFTLMSVGVDAKGNVYGADFEDNGVKVFTPDGKFVLMVPLQSSLQKKSPGKGTTGVAVNSRGDIYITDGANGRIQVNDLNGKYKYQITKFKDKSGKELAMNGPSDPEVNSFDELYVLDSFICRAHRFNVKGGYVGSFGYMGDGAGGFNAPCGLAIDKLDRVYICDIGFGVIQVFSRQGKFLFALCDENGKKLSIPFVNGMGVDNDNLIYVSVNDSGGYRVRVFKYLTKATK